MTQTASTSLELRTLIYVRELADGRVVCFPLADHSLQSFGEERSALDEQRTFLEEYLVDQRPEVLARFSFPEGTQLEEVEVQVGREDLPSRLQLQKPIAIACVVIPHGRERWVVIPSLDHTFHAGADEELAEAVGDEVRRVAGAMEATPLEFLALFPARAHRIEQMALQLDRSLKLVPGRARALRKTLAERRQRADAQKILESVARPLHEAGDVLRGPPLVGRGRELEELGALLGGKDRLSLLLLGEPGVGKTALLHAWIRERPAGRVVYGLSASRLLAGMSGFGQWQERVLRVMRAAENLDALLVFDGLGELFGDRAGGHVDLAGAIRPFLDEGRVRMLGELSPEEVDRYEGLHAGFMSSLQRLRLQPLSAAQAVEVVHSHIGHAARHAPHRPNLDERAVQPLVDLVDRYLPAAAYPGKAIRLLGDVRSLVESGGTSHGDTPPPIGEGKVLEAFSLQTGVPLFLLRQDQPLKLEEIEAALRRRLIGQQDAVRRVAETVCMVKARLQPPAKPLATFLFIGPTGVGKTELARALASFLFGTEARLARFDMSEYMDAWAAERLIRGTDRVEGLLTRKIRQQPFCVLLLDEIEKAHPAVFDLLLQVCGEGRLTDAGGRIAHFHNTILIMTSNLGASAKRPLIGLHADDREAHDYYLEQVNRAFRPEFVNRIDRIVSFHALGENETLEVARIAVQRLPLRRGLIELGITATTREGALRRLAVAGTSPTYGARAFRRHLETEVVAPLARLLARLTGRARGTTLQLLDAEEANHQAGPGELLAEERHGALCLRLSRGPGVLRARGARGVTEIGELRRAVDRIMRLEPIVEVKEQIELIVAQLATAGHGRRSAQEVTQLKTEHDRLLQIWSRGEAARRELCDVEELALTALLDEEDPSPLLAEGRVAAENFRVALFYLMAALRHARDAATVLVQEVEGHTYEVYLAPLIEQLAVRRWSLTAHLDGGEREAGDDWPAGRRWGPPRAADWLAQRLQTGRRPGALLLRISGPWAGVVFGLEAGLHSFPGEPKPGLLHVRFLTAAVQLSDDDWASPKLNPATPAGFPELRRLPVERRYQDPAGPLWICSGQRQVEVPLASYWQRYELIGAEHMLASAEDPERELDDLFIPELQRSGRRIKEGA